VRTNWPVGAVQSVNRVHERPHLRPLPETPLKGQRTSTTTASSSVVSAFGVGTASGTPATSNADRVNALSGLLAMGKDGSTSGDLVGDAVALNGEQGFDGLLFVGGVSGADVIQGAGAKDCYFLAVLASIADQNPQFIEGMIADNGGGNYAVRFYTVAPGSTGESDLAFEPRWISVTNVLPTQSDGTLAFGRSDGVSSDGQPELWVSIVEKAFTVLDEEPSYLPNWAADNLGLDSNMSDTRGGYEGIWSGFSEYAMATLLGNGESRDISDAGDGATAEWDVLVAALNAGKAVTVDNVSLNMGFGLDYDGGLSPAHSVSVIGYSFDGSRQVVHVYNQQGGDEVSERIDFMEFDDFLAKYDKIHIGEIPTDAPTTAPTNAPAGANRIDMARLALEASGLTVPSWDADVGRAAISAGIMDKKETPEDASDAEVISGLKLNDPVIRAEAAKMLLVASGVTPDLPADEVAYFYDVPQNEWYYDWMHAARLYGLFKGDEDTNRARPGATLSTLEIGFLQGRVPVSEAYATLEEQANGGPIITDPELAQTIDINVPFVYQREDNDTYGFTGGDYQCFYASKTMVENTETPDGGVTVTGGTVANNYFMGTGQDENGDLIVDSEKAEAARAYLDAELEAGHPVVVGLTFKDSHYDQENVDGIADHFVVVNGRTGTGDSARYTFLDPWSASEEDAHGEFTVQSDGKLVYDASEKGSKLDSHYEVSSIRKNTV
jgi:hypothetical protein